MTEDEYNKSIALRAIWRTIAQTQPRLTVEEGYRLALEIEEKLREELAVEEAPDHVANPGSIRAGESLRDYYVRIAKWIDASPDAEEIREDMTLGKKINAIKELRGATLCGLKEAKEAIELWERGGHLR